MLGGDRMPASVCVCLSVCNAACQPSVHSEISTDVCYDEVRMHVLLTAVSVRGSVERLRSGGVGGITLTSEPASTRNRSSPGRAVWGRGKNGTIYTVCACVKCCRILLVCFSVKSPCHVRVRDHVRLTDTFAIIC